ncbi:MAG TPA: shikimate kinase [Prevotellaceae bacterium]|nr:shikimate kinase [Prevotellaceae bacterium]HBE55905.1 shikimate kinase [Prevotellaceae bacterium]
MRRIILVGYMGSGKTTIGRQLALALGLEFYDLDWYIETRYRSTVAQIFAQRGEDGFREMERNMLHEVAEFEDIVLSCGGGTPCFFDNMDYLNAQGETVYLKATPEVLARHLRMGRVERPLIKGKSEGELLQYIQSSLQAREPFYGKAKNIIDVNLLDNRAKIQDSVRLLCKTLHLPSHDCQRNKTRIQSDRNEEMAN